MRKRLKTALMDEQMVRLNIELLAGGGYAATSADLPGLVAQGFTVAETIDIARDVARKIIESCIIHGDPIPTLKRVHRRKMQAFIPVTVAL